MGERLTPEQAAEQVKDGDNVLVSYQAKARTSFHPGGPPTYVMSGALRYVELLPPDPQPGEWWLVHVGQGKPCVMQRVADGWSHAIDGDREWIAHSVTPLRRMTFADSAG